MEVKVYSAGYISFLKDNPQFSIINYQLQKLMSCRMARKPFFAAG